MRFTLLLAFVSCAAACGGSSFQSGADVLEAGASDAAGPDVVRTSDPDAGGDVPPSLEAAADSSAHVEASSPTEASVDAQGDEQLDAGADVVDALAELPPMAVCPLSPPVYCVTGYEYLVRPLALPEDAGIPCGMAMPHCPNGWGCYLATDPANPVLCP